MKFSEQAMSVGWFILWLLVCQWLFAASGGQAPARADVSVTFTEVSAKTSGITWTHANARSPERHLPETIGAGCAFFDYDNDGWLDIYLVNGGETPKGKSKTPVHSALYRNLGGGRFEDVASKAGIDQLLFMA